MTPEKAKELVAIHPDWFLGLWPWTNRPVPEDFLEHVYHHVCVGDGWYLILHTLLKRLDSACESEPTLFKDFKIVQIKEKFGGLRFYVHNSNPVADFFINEAETRSNVTCEFCGQSGIRQGVPNWIKSACEPCAEKERARHEMR